MWNKQGLCSEALVGRPDGGCVRAQLPDVVLRRQQTYAPRGGQKKQVILSDTMAPAFTFSELFKNGGLWDQAFENSAHHGIGSCVFRDLADGHARHTKSDDANFHVAKTAKGSLFPVSHV